MSIGVAVVGAGLIGARRAAAAAAHPDCRLVAVVDVDAGRAQVLADRHGAAALTDWREAVAMEGVDAVAVATVNRELAPISIGALEAGRDVLCEKPPGRSREEAEAIAEAAQRAGRHLKVGFTLRFHPALRRAREVCSEGGIGAPYFIRSVYGHGGRPGYAAEWRGSRELSGGGELLDQGVHLLDLARWFLGDLEVVAGLVPRYHWEIGDLEDNAFMLLRAPAGQVANLQTSWTQWRNRFDFEVHGSEGFLRVSGLGGSYGPETLAVGRRHPESKPPEEETFSFDGPDRSFEADWDDFVAMLRDGRPPEVGIDDGVEVMRLVEAVYRSAAAAG